MVCQQLSQSEQGYSSRGGKMAHSQLELDKLEVSIQQRAAHVTRRQHPELVTIPMAEHDIDR